MNWIIMIENILVILSRLQIVVYLSTFWTQLKVLNSFIIDAESASFSLYNTINKFDIIIHVAIFELDIDKLITTSHSELFYRYHL
jgi:hypothetical protein